MFIVDDGYTSEKLDDKAANWFRVSKKPSEKLKQRVVPLKVYVIPPPPPGWWAFHYSSGKMRYKIANTEIAVPLNSFNLHGTMFRAFANICTYISFDSNVYVFVYRT